MQTPLLIGVAGVKQAGKGTAFHFIEEWASSLGLSARERGFADYVKWMLARIFFPNIGMDDAIKWYDENKEDPNVRMVIEYRDRPHVHEADISFRQAGQHFGTESGRDLCGGDFWARLLLPEGTKRLRPADASSVYPAWWDSFDLGPDFADICGVTDLRFEEEYEQIKKVTSRDIDPDAVLIKIRNREAEQKIINEAKAQGREIHRSELGLPDRYFDYVVSNDGTKEELALKMRYVMNEVHGNIHR